MQSPARLPTFQSASPRTRWLLRLVPGSSRARNTTRTFAPAPYAGIGKIAATGHPCHPARRSRRGDAKDRRHADDDGLPCTTSAGLVPPPAPARASCLSSHPIRQRQVLRPDRGGPTPSPARCSAAGSGLLSYLSYFLPASFSVAAITVRPQPSSQAQRDGQEYRCRDGPSVRRLASRLHLCDRRASKIHVVILMFV